MGFSARVSLLALNCRPALSVVRSCNSLSAAHHTEVIRLRVRLGEAGDEAPLHRAQLRLAVLPELEHGRPVSWRDVFVWLVVLLRLPALGRDACSAGHLLRCQGAAGAPAHGCACVKHGVGLYLEAGWMLECWLTGSPPLPSGVPAPGRAVMVELGLLA